MGKIRDLSKFFKAVFNTNIDFNDKEKVDS